MSVLEEIAVERRRQDAKWGGPDHDDHHGSGELALAAALYAIPYKVPGLKQDDYLGLQMLLELGLEFGPLSPEPDDRTRYIKAAALLVAEVERLDRAAVEIPFEPGEADPE
ncbi:hypothetical protein [Azospirillum sp. sgz302134]